MDNEAFREEWDGIEKFELLDTYTTGLLEWSDELCSRVQNGLRGVSNHMDRTKMIQQFIREVEQKGRESPYLHETVYVTGEVCESYFDVASGKNKEKDSQLKGEPLVWGGLHCGMIETGDTPQPVVGYRLVRPRPTVVRFLGSLTDTHYYHSITAPIGSIEVKGHDYGVVQYPRFRDDHPDIARHLSSCLEDVEEDECGAVMRLASLRLPETLLEDEIEVIESYLNHQVQLDQAVPYQAELKGPAYIEARGLDRDIPLNLDEKVLMTGIRLGLAPQKGVDAPEQYLVPYLDAALLTSYRQGRPQWVKLPLTSISRLVSGRTLLEDNE